MKIMLDTNAFDFIYANQLVDKINLLVNQNKISLYTTHIQSDEIEKIPDSTKKDKIKEISCNLVNTSVVIIGTDNDTDRGFIGSTIGFCNIAGDEDTPVIENALAGHTASHPLGNSADVAISHTALKENMDYLVSDDMAIPKISKELGSTVKIIKNSEFYEIIKNLMM